LVQARRREADAVLSAAEEGLEGWAARKDAAEEDRIWDIQGRQETLSRLKEIVGRAEEMILL
jgi:sugar-specific transcriptional regulator TrmB